MENHLHLILSSPDLSSEIGKFKSFTARQIIDFLERNISLNEVETIANNVKCGYENNKSEMIISLIDDISKSKDFNNYVLEYKNRTSISYSDESFRNKLTNIND